MNILLISYYIVVGITLFFIAKKDIQSRVIDTHLLSVLVSAWAVHVWVEGMAFYRVVASVGAAVFLYMSLLVFSLIYERVRGHYSMGGGDLKLFAVSALLVGPSHVLPLVFVSSLLGLVVYALQPRGQGLFPFGPAIVVATYLFLMTL